MKLSIHRLVTIVAFTLLALNHGLRAQTAGVVTTLYSFKDAVPYGELRYSGLVEGNDGDFYGTTETGGSARDCGTVFRITPAGAVTILHNFIDKDGANPAASLVQGRDGNFYGTTVNYGEGTNGGTIFQITPAGVLTTLHDFTGSGSDGAEPMGSLVQGRDGNFYGTTRVGGSNRDGTVFAITPGGAFTTLYSFSAINDSYINTDGSEPVAGLVEGSDGNFYGTTQYGGPAGAGTVFKITPVGVLTTLHSFTGPDGAAPLGNLVQGRDGNFYGTTEYGGSSSGSGGYGTIFKITSAGVLTTLHSFTGTSTGGAYPLAGLVEGTDGNFYGTSTTSETDNGSAGTVFQLTPAGVLTTLHSFTGTGTDGAYPHAGLVQGSDGNFYGTTEDGGKDNVGTVFKLDMMPVITSATAVTTAEGKAFSYQIHATNSPTRYGVQGLPSFLSVNPSTGIVSGTPTAVGTVSLTLNAYDDFGKGSATLALTIIGVPVITSAAKATATKGKPFSYQITATNSPTSFGVQGLPSGITVDTTKGLVSGTPKATGTFNMTLNVYNAAGKGSATLTLAVKSAPVITSATTATATQGSAFSYQITATQSPTSFGVQGLPAGITVNTATGVISGTPKGAGKVTLTLNAYNSVGKGSATLTLTIKAAPPVITSATTATATVGKAFSYQITASNQPTSFGVQGLPAGYTANSTTGLITGTPKAAGKVNLTLNAYNSVGKGSAALTLTVAAQ